MPKDKKKFSNRYGDEAPSIRVFLMIIAIVLVIIAFAWFSYYEFGWLAKK